MEARATQPAWAEPAQAELIRDTALTLFAEQGYSGTTMANIAAARGVTAGSLYKHLRSKQQLLAEVMLGTMRTLLDGYQRATTSAGDVPEQLRRATEVHMRYHARSPREVMIGNREIHSLEDPNRGEVLEMRRRYAHEWEKLIERGVQVGAFNTPSPKLAAYAILEMGIGISMWFRPDGPMSEAEVVWHYTDIAQRIVGAKSPSQADEPNSPDTTSEG